MTISTSTIGAADPLPSILRLCGVALLALGVTCVACCDPAAPPAAEPLGASITSAPRCPPAPPPMPCQPSGKGFCADRAELLATTARRP